jgi:hypothetical protein
MQIALGDQGKYEEADEIQRQALLEEEGTEILIRRSGRNFDIIVEQCS